MMFDEGDARELAAKGPFLKWCDQIPRLPLLAFFHGIVFNIADGLPDASLLKQIDLPTAALPAFRDFAVLVEEVLERVNCFFFELAGGVLLEADGQDVGRVALGPTTKCT